MILNNMKYGRISHLTLLDPDKVNEENIGRIMEIINNSGSDGIMVGGSTATDTAVVDKTVTMIKKYTKLPVILFPSASTAISPKADAIFFMSLLNSRDREYIIGHQVKAARAIREMKMEVISLAYLIFEPGMTVGRVGNAILIGRDDVETALSYSLAAEMLGFSALYLEAGSGADRPIDKKVVESVTHEVTIPVIVGGGIRDPQTAKEFIDAGATTIVTGTIAEKDPNMLAKIIKSIKAR
jgi:geranylgeranylglyceryl diphosphate synthase (EC 2.5.1.41)